MEFVLRSCIFYSLLIVVYNRPTIETDDDDDNKDCYVYYNFNLTNNTQKRYCGEELENMLSRICVEYNSEVGNYNFIFIRVLHQR